MGLIGEVGGGERSKLRLVSVFLQLLRQVVTKTHLDKDKNYMTAVKTNILRLLSVFGDTG